ncbi:MAG: protease modulator HflC [Alphaproteobacteria bacterium]|jgi:membrane protease subunit HflC|nr:protease modulator HflC [Alphaproteobacteria bacterium]
MNANTLRIGLAIVVVVLGVVGYSSLFTVQETEQALVLRLGEPRRQVKEPGLHFKMPIIENVEMMEKRILDYDPPQEEIIASDKKRLVVDAYTRYRISNPLQFYRTVNNETFAGQRLAVIINSSVRRVLATVELQSVLSGERRELMHQIRSAVNSEAEKIGIAIIDVRIKRADLPEENSLAVFRRMQAERERDAKEARARGAEESQKIKADADRQKTVLLAEARKLAEILRGEGDATRNRIYAQAFSKDPEFFRFYRSLEAYRKAMDAKDTTLVLSPDSDFFRYFGDQMGGSKQLEE